MKHLGFVRSHGRVNSRVRSVHVGSTQIFVAKFQEGKIKNLKATCGQTNQRMVKGDNANPSESSSTATGSTSQLCLCFPFSLWEKVNVFFPKAAAFFAGSWNVCPHNPIPARFPQHMLQHMLRRILDNAGTFCFFLWFCRGRLSRTVRYSQEKKFAASLGAKLILLAGLNRLENQEHFVFFSHEHQYIRLSGFRCCHWSSGVGKISGSLWV